MRVDIVFDGPPGPVSGRFVEVESPPGTSIRFGEWVHRDDGYWALRFEATALDAQPSPEGMETTAERSTLIAEAIQGYYGDRCADYADGCCCCRAWADFDRLLSDKAAAVKAETERCAGIADEWKSTFQNDKRKMAAQSIAAAIRGGEQE